MSLPRSAPPFLREEAYTWIRDRILRGEFALGDPLNRRRLAAHLRMSLLPVSEALRKLESDGLVETQRRAGTRVRIPAIEDIEDHVVIRTALECESARLFCARAEPEDRRDLLARAEHLDYLRARTGVVPYEKERDKDLAYAIHAYHDEFHLRIVDGARCGALRRLMEEKQVLTLHWLYDVATGNVAPLDSHTTLARAIAGKDPDKAAAAMREHVVRGSQHLLAGFQSLYNQDAATDGRQPAGRRWRDTAARTKPAAV